MIGVPAAAASQGRVPRPNGLDGRLLELLERSGPASNERLAARLLPARSLEDVEDPTATFHWLLIADWLAESFGLTASPSGRTLLADLAWIQYCVYGFFRAQDDLVDGDVRDPLLAVEANQLLVEAASCAAQHFQGASFFWSVFRETLDATSGAIVELDRIQRSPEHRGECDLELYVDLAACLKIAAAGVALAAGREREWRENISPALDLLAVAAQVLDDVHDLAEDLGAGRINYVAWALARPVFGSTAEATEAVVASNLATTNRLDVLFGQVRSLVDEAARLVPPELCARTHSYLVDYGAGVSELARGIRESRRALFGA